VSLGIKMEEDHFQIDALFVLHLYLALSLLGREEENKMEKTNNKEINQIPQVQDRPPESICMYTKRAAGIPK
jgi:hypothetical protein